MHIFVLSDTVVTLSGALVFYLCINSYKVVVVDDVI